MRQAVHEFIDGSSTGLSAGKIVCVGRNYAAHAKELNNPIPDEPVLFMKPSTALLQFEEGFAVPEGVHYEAELALLIGEESSAGASTSMEGLIAGVGLALDLTKRDLQSELKSKGLPWERAKAFDGACPMTRFVPLSAFDVEVNQLEFRFRINDVERQFGKLSMMLNPIPELLAAITAQFTLLPGDVVLTGTPEGVGQLHSGDALELDLHGKANFRAQLA